MTTVLEGGKTKITILIFENVTFLKVEFSFIMQSVLFKNVFKKHSTYLALLAKVFKTSKKVGLHVMA